MRDLRRIRSALLAAACLLPAANAARALAASDVTALRGELAARSQSRDAARAQSAELAQQIARLDAQLAELKAIEASGEKGVSDKKARLDALNAREAALKAEMGRNQAALAGLLGALELYRREPPPALLVSPRSAKDAVRGAILARAAQPELARGAQALRLRAEELARIRRSISAASEDLFTSESALADNRAGVEQALKEKLALQRQLDADAADAGRRAQSLEAQLRALGVGPGPPLAAPSGPPPTALLTPTAGEVVRRFGQASPGGQTSDGLTFRTAAGAVVRAPAAGTVEYSGPLKGWGGVLILNVGGGYHLVLAGLDRIAPTAGRRVANGEPVGGMSQRAGPAPELYMELRREGVGPQDPSHWLRADSSAGGSSK